MNKEIFIQFILMTVGITINRGVPPEMVRNELIRFVNNDEAWRILAINGNTTALIEGGKFAANICGIEVESNKEDK